MALVESTRIPLGMVVPAFKLPDSDGVINASDQLFGANGLLILFTCNHCPYARAVWPRIIQIAGFAKERKIETVAINPNIHPDYTEDSPENMKVLIDDLKIPFPYLVDEQQDTARNFKAACTPDIYLCNNEQRLVYHGRIDDNWKDIHLVKKNDLKNAIDCLVTGQPIEDEQHPSIGCSIKWK